MLNAISRKAAGMAVSSIWTGTSNLTDSGGGATDVIVVKQPDGSLRCTSFHAQLPRLSKENFMGTRVQLFVNNVPTALSMVLDRDLICCFEDGSYRASSEELESLNLYPGRNSIRYELIHPVNNERRFTVRADIHLWEVWDKIVIVDIDGTVTKTDVAGFGAEKLGYEYIHAGVCEAVSTIARQGYRVLFLTSRAITLAHSTREFLRSIGFSNGGAGMPEFALLTTTERFLPSLVVGVRSADKFKTVALTEILRLFRGEAAGPYDSPDVSVPGWRREVAPGGFVGTSKWDRVWKAPLSLDGPVRADALGRDGPGGGGGDGGDDVDQGRGQEGCSGSGGERGGDGAVHRGGDGGSGASKGGQRRSPERVAGELDIKTARDQDAPRTPAVGPGAAAPPGVPVVRLAGPRGAQLQGPFVAGFGNRMTDIAAYNAVGVPLDRNFLIDQSSQIRTMTLAPIKRGAGGGVSPPGGFSPGAGLAPSHSSFDGYTGLLPHVRRLLPALSPQGVPLAEKDTDCTWGACPLDCACDEVVL